MLLGAMCMKIELRSWAGQQRRPCICYNFISLHEWLRVRLHYSESYHLACAPPHLSRGVYGACAWFQVIDAAA
jgi:hypothetical protein